MPQWIDNTHLQKSINQNLKLFIGFREAEVGVVWVYAGLSDVCGLAPAEWVQVTNSYAIQIMTG